MSVSYTVRYIRTRSGYTGQIVEWPEVISEGKTIEECRVMVEDALKEMILASRERGDEIPLGGSLLEQIVVEV